MSNKSKRLLYRVMNPIAGKPNALVCVMVIAVFLIISIIILFFKDHLFLLWLTFVWRVVVVARPRVYQS